MQTHLKWAVVVLGLVLGGTMWAVAEQSKSIVELTKMLEEKADEKDMARDFTYARDNHAALNKKFEIELQNSELERDRVDQVHTGQINNLIVSVDNLATGVRELAQLKGSVSSAQDALTEATEKVAAVEVAVRELVLKLEESRRGESGEVGATVLSPEDKVLLTIEVAALADRLEAELRAVNEKLEAANQRLGKIQQTQDVEEAKEDE